MSKNQNLHEAKKVKNDEFYTFLENVENELHHYKDFFRDKIVFCNCNDHEQSSFYKYFDNEFIRLGLKKLITTCYNKAGSSYKLEIVLDYNGNKQYRKIDLLDGGDFRDNECVELLQEADIVVTNPPFSLFREYIAQLMKFNKKFIIIGSYNAVPYKDIFPLIRDNKLWLGVNSVKEFYKPDGSNQKFGNICWYTNIVNNRRNDNLLLSEIYIPNNYPVYDNYDAIEVSKVKNIPKGYNGCMGVPINFLDKYNPDQFKIIDIDVNLTERKSRFYINGRMLYARIVIKRKDADEQSSLT